MIQDFIYHITCERIRPMRNDICVIFYFWTSQAKVGLEKEFELSLRRLRGKDANVSAEAAEIKVCFFTLST